MDGAPDTISDETNPADLMVPFPSELMRIWPMRTRVNKAGNEAADLIEPVELDDDGPSGTLL